jgi:hypothetical protein
VLTLSVVPAAIVAAFRDEAAKQAKHVASSTVGVFVFISLAGLRVEKLPTVS